MLGSKNFDMIGKRNPKRPIWPPELHIYAPEKEVVSYRENDRVILEVEVPGFSKDEITIKFDSGQISVRAQRERPDEYSVDHRNYSYSTGLNSIENVKAVLENGVLKISYDDLNSSEAIEIPIEE